MLDRLSRLLLHHSLGIQPGEIISIHGSASAGPFLRALRQAAAEAGAECWAWGKPEPSAAVHVSPPRDETRGGWQLSGVAGEHARSERIRWVATLFPADAFWEDVLRRGAFLDEPEPAAAWKAQEARQKRLIEQITDARFVHVETPSGTDLRLCVSGCPWRNGAGQHNMPDGEIYTVPCAEGTEGIFVADSPLNARLRIERGEVVSVETSSPLMPRIFLEPGARGIHEIGLGCHPTLTDFTGHALIDEKIAGTIHIGVGAALTGAREPGPMHLDLVCDARNGTITWQDGRGTRHRPALPARVR